ncbi:MAG TPA: glycosyltransferase [Pyrinomonadaceae bacterium]
MKIFFPLEVFYPSQAGGPANSVYWLAKTLLNEGFEPIVVASDKGLDSDFPRNVWRDNEAGKVIHVKTRFLHFPFRQTVYALRNFFRADVVHISSIFYPTGFIVAFAARALKKKLSGRPEVS